VDWNSRDGLGKTDAGPLVNVGSKLAPLNGQVFIQYSGLWGSPAGFLGNTGGYWGPAFNETGMEQFHIADFFSIAWCTGFVNLTRERECKPFMRSP
jgi:hypothetical protein